MKITIEISEATFERAKKAAAREKTTLRAFVQRALRRALDGRRSPRAFRLRDGSFRGRGLRPGIAGDDWEKIRNLVYEGHGA